MITRRETLLTLVLGRCAFADASRQKQGQQKPGLVGMYFNMPANLKEPPFEEPAPTVVRIDPSLDFDWRREPPSPRVGSRNFSARWQGFLYLPAAGVYTLRLSHDSGLRMQIGGELVYSYWRGRRSQFLADHRFAKAGWAPIQVQYHALRTRTPRLRLEWAPPGASEIVPVPASVFAHLGQKQ